MSNDKGASSKQLRAIGAGALVTLVLLATGVWMLRSQSPERDEPAAADTDLGPPGVAEPEAPGNAAAVPPVGAAGSSAVAIPDVSVVTPVPPDGTRAKRRVWVSSKYGDGEGQLGIELLAPGAEGETHAPQGFTTTPKGDLLVLDSAKKRLVWYGPDGSLRRTQPIDEMVKPADVDVAADGTVVVMDHAGLHTEGTLLLDPQGKRKGMLPQAGGGMIVGLDVVGNDIYGNMGGTSIKLGDTSGTPTHETPGVYDQDGTIPGHLAPDGRTVISRNVENVSEGVFLISVLRDEPPRHLFTRQYRIDVEESLDGIYLVQADAHGTIYVVLYYDSDKMSLVCLDGVTGEPLGRVAMPMVSPDGGSVFRPWRVVPGGGVVYHHATDDASTYEIYDCR